MKLLDINFNKLTCGEKMPTTLLASSLDGKNKILIVFFSLSSATNGIVSANSIPPTITNVTWKKFNPFVKQGCLPCTFIIVTYNTYC